MSYLSDMDDIDMTCSDFVNTLNSFEDIFLGNTRHLYKKNKPTLGSSGEGGGVHGKVCWLIAYL